MRAICHRTAVYSYAILYQSHTHTKREPLRDNTHNENQRHSINFIIPAMLRLHAAVVVVHHITARVRCPSLRRTMARAVFILTTLVRSRAHTIIL